MTTTHDEQIMALTVIGVALNDAYQTFVRHLSDPNLGPFDTVTTKQWLKNVKKAADVMEITLAQPLAAGDTSRLFDV